MTHVCVSFTSAAGMWRVTPCHIFALLEPCHEARGKSKINRRQLLRLYLATSLDTRREFSELRFHGFSS